LAPFPAGFPLSPPAASGILDRVQPSPNSRLIPVRSGQQAREWSLALVSQGIESVLVQDDVTETWALEVEAQNLGPALQVLKQYHIENRGWGLQRELPVVGLSFHWGCAGWGLMMTLVHFAATLPQSRLTAAGVLSQKVRLDGEWWRLITAMTLHNDIGHLASNLASGTLLLGLCMARHGPGLALGCSLVAGAAANLAALRVYGSTYQSLGASGMVLAVLGILTSGGAIEAFRRRPGWKPLFATLGAGLMLFLLTGSNPASDLVVHLGGFLAGLVMGALLECLPSRFRMHRAVQVTTLALTTGTFLVAWLVALSKP
jgi:rhomboid protease GluP